MSNSTKNTLVLILAVVIGVGFVVSGIQKLAAGETLPEHFAKITDVQFVWYLIGFAEMGLGIGLIVPSMRKITVLLVAPWFVGAMGALVVSGTYPADLLYPAIGIALGVGGIYLLMKGQPESKENEMASA